MKCLVFILSAMIVSGLSGCTPEKMAGKRIIIGGDPNEEAISNTVLKNCHFQDSAPSYSFNSPIPANPIICEEGVPKKVEKLNIESLPDGIEFSNEKISLVGSANEKVIQAPYQFYIENEAGYQILKLKITIK